MREASARTWARRQAGWLASCAAWPRPRSLADAGEETAMEGRRGTGSAGAAARARRPCPRLWPPVCAAFPSPDEVELPSRQLAHSGMPLCEAFPMTHPREELRARLQTDRPHSARVWNYLLGGKDNYPVDSEAGEVILKTFPEFAAVARLQRRFLGRAVRFLAGEAGVRQFLDIGTGLPTAENTHELAQRIAPESRIVYVDNDPLVLVHAQALLTSSAERLRLRRRRRQDPERILAEAAKTLDFSRPVALTMLGIMGQISDAERPADLVSTLMSALPSGSYLASVTARTPMRHSTPRSGSTTGSRPTPTTCGHRRRSLPSSAGWNWWSRGSCPRPPGARTRPDRRGHGRCLRLRYRGQEVTRPAAR